MASLLVIRLVSIAFVGFDEQKVEHQAKRLYVMNNDGSNIRNLTEDLDRAIDDFQ